MYFIDQGGQIKARESGISVYPYCHRAPDGLAARASPDKKLSEPETTYNLEVADFHTYYVSDACVLVHNECWGTTRRKYWKQQAKNPINTGKYEISSFNIDRMAKGKAPIGYDGRSIELHHIFGKSKDMNSFVQLTRSEHMAFHKTYGYKVFPNIFGGG